MLVLIDIIEILATKFQTLVLTFLIETFKAFFILILSVKNAHPDIAVRATLDIQALWHRHNLIKVYCSIFALNKVEKLFYSFLFSANNDAVCNVIWHNVLVFKFMIVY